MKFYIGVQGRKALLTSCFLIERLSMQTYAQLQSFSKYNAIAIIGVIVEDFFERLRPHNMVTLAGQY